MVARAYAGTVRIASLQRRRWRIAGEPVPLESAIMPTMLVIPEQNRSVLPLLATALADFIPDSTRMIIAAGHISVITGTKAVSFLCSPLA